MVTLRPRAKKALPRNNDTVANRAAVGEVTGRKRKAKDDDGSKKTKVKKQPVKIRRKKDSRTATLPSSKKKAQKTKNNAKKEDSNNVLASFLHQAVPDKSKHADLEQLYNMIRTHAPTLAPEIQLPRTLAFGGFDYETKSKCAGRWARVGIMVNKTGLSLFVVGIKEGTYLLEHYDKKQIIAADKTNKGSSVSIGKSCIRFKKLKDLNLDTLQRLVHEMETVAAMNAVV